MDKESITSRLTRLSQMVNGRIATKEGLGINGLVDSLVVLHKECSMNSTNTDNQFVKDFARKFEPIVKELSLLRTSPRDYDLKSVIGRGHFGEVRVAVERSSGNVYAMKIIRKDSLLSQLHVSSYEEERNIMSRSSSTWIVRLHHSFQDDEHLYLVMDFHSGGDLHSLISRHEGTLDEPMARFYLAEMTLAINSLHLMGYVHRDIKPENILIDRTGHVKLADFGSSCSLAENNAALHHRKMFIPVGTPDYICPELLTLAGADQSQLEGPDDVSRGEECDWWSLGVCAYEMICGRLPFSGLSESNSKLALYSSIMNHKASLKFPKDSSCILSEAAKSLIEGLLDERCSRLKYQQVRGHKFFEGIHFDGIRQAPPPYIPSIRSEDDTSNFSEPPQASKHPKTVHFFDDPIKSRDTDVNRGLSGRDLPFVGFTFDRVLSALGTDVGSLASPSRPENSRSSSSSRRSLLGDGVIMHNNSSFLDNQLLAQEARDWSVRLREAELKFQVLEKNLELTKKMRAESERRMERAEEERNEAERQLFVQRNANKSLKRTLDAELEKFSNVEEKTKQRTSLLVQNLKEEFVQREKKFREEVEGHRLMMSQLEEELAVKDQQLERVEKELKDWRVVGSLNSGNNNQEKTAPTQQLEEFKMRLKIELKQAYRTKMRSAAEKMKSVERDHHKKEESLRSKLVEACQAQLEVEKKLSASEVERMTLEGELKLLKEKIEDFEGLEERSKALESEVRNLRETKKRERELTFELDNRNLRCQTLEITTKHLEDEMERLKREKEDVVNQSIMSLSENEDRMKIIQQQEAIIEMLKTNISAMEHQIRSLKCDLTEAKSLGREAAGLRKSRSTRPHLEMTFLGVVDYIGDKEDDDDDKNNNGDECERSDDDDDDDDDAVLSPVKNVNEVICNDEGDKENKPCLECHDDDGDDDIVGDEEDDGNDDQNLIDESGVSKSKKYVSCHMAAVRGKKFPLDDKIANFDIDIDSKCNKIRSSGCDGRGRASADKSISSRKTTLEMKTENSSVLAEISLQFGNKEKRAPSKRDNFGHVRGQASRKISCERVSVPDSPQTSRSTKSWPYFGGMEASTAAGWTELTPYSPKSTTITDKGDGEDSPPEAPKQCIQETVDAATSPLCRRSFESSDLSSDAGHLVMTVTTRLCQGSGVKDIFNDTLDSIVEANSDVSRSGDAMAMGLARSSSHSRSSRRDKQSKEAALPEKVSRGQNVGLDGSGLLFEKDPVNCGDDFCQGLVERLKGFEEQLRREVEEIVDKSTEDKRRESTVKSLEREIERLKTEIEKLEHEREEERGEMLKSRESDGVIMERSLAAKDEEIAKLKESVHEQRIRVLDIKYELREKISAYEREVSELKCKLLQSEIVSTDLERLQRSRKEEEEELRSKVEAKEKLIKEAELKSNDTRKQLEDMKSDNIMLVASLNGKIEELDKQLVEEQSSNQNLKKEVEKGKEQLSSSEASNEDLKMKMKNLADENRELRSSVSRLHLELEGMTGEKQSLARQNEQLVNTCLELESQAVEMEALLKQKEELKEVERLKRAADDGRAADVTLEISKLKRELEGVEEKYKQLLEKNGMLNKQLMQAESKHSAMEVERQRSSLRKQEDSSSSLFRMIKEESDSRSTMLMKENNQLKGELVTSKKEADDLKREVKQLQTLTKELEEQMEMMEAIDSKTKRRISDMLVEDDAKRKEFSKKEARVAELAHQFRMESQARKNSESKLEELTKKLDSINQERKLEVERLNKQVNVQTEKILQLNSQLSATEDRCSTFELEVKNLRRCLETRDQELNLLKEEISKEITRLQTIKSTNVTLGEELEARKNNERMLNDRRVELENILQSLRASYQEDKFRMEETISQQGKLIDFLQAKVESQPQKKKLFGSKRTEPAPYPVVNDWKAEVQKRNSKNCDVENIIGSSQKYGTLPSQSTLPPQQGVAIRQRPISTVVARNPTNQNKEDKDRRSLANPNHNFKTSIFCRPTKCIVCLGTIYFIQQSAKCLDCGAMCHPKCLPHLPFNCGMESEYSAYSAEVDRISRNSCRRSPSAARSRDSQPILLSGVVKVNGSVQMAGSKQKNPQWQKMLVTIKGTRLELSDLSGKEKLEAVFELCPSESEGEAVVESSLVSHEKVPSYSSSSLLNPLLLLEPNELMLVIVVRLEGPYSVTRDGRPQPRVVYLLPSDFKEKQHLVAALETVVNSNQNSKHKIRDAKVLGNMLLRLDAKRTEGRSQKMEINCTWPYNGEVILLGTSLGLFAMVLNNTPEDRPMVKLEGVPTIHSMEILAEHQMLFAVAGPDRDLVSVDLPILQNFLVQSQAFSNGSGPRPQPISYKGLPKATGCTVFAAKKTGGNLYLCVATLAQKILMFKYNYSCKEFVLKKEYDTSQLCSCLKFGSERVVVGAGKFYHINLETLNLADFMSPADPTLSFVADSAAKYGSQPIEVLAINEPNQPEEFLLCYCEFGVFVDGQGFRSRDENMNWSGLPLSFAFRKPFLYMVHYSSIQLVEIPPKDEPPRAPLRASINLPGACYLGPAVTPGAVYLGSSMDGVSEVICLRGNKIPEAKRLYPSLCD